MKAYAYFVLCVLFCCITVPSMGRYLEDVKTEQLFEESLRRLSELFDDVDEIKDELASIKDRLPEDEQRDRSHANGHRTTRVERALGTIRQINEDVIEIRVDHNWNNLVSSYWVSRGTAVLPDMRYYHESLPGTIRLFLRIRDIQDDNTFPGSLVTLFVRLDDDYYGFEFDVLRAISTTNKVNDGTGYGYVQEELHVFPTVVLPAQDISYNQGDVFDIRIYTERNARLFGGGMVFNTVGNDTDESFAFTYRMHDDLHGTPFSMRQNITNRILQVNSTTLDIGGIFFLVLNYRIDSTVLFKCTTIKMIRIHPMNSAPVPDKRVAILRYYANQTLSVDDQTGIVSCEAIGNPVPEVEIRINGSSADTLSAEWSWDYGTLHTVYDIPSEQLIDGQVTCFAKSGSDVAEIDITFRYKLAVVYELTKVNHLSNGTTEVMCVFKGKPTPGISFYKQDERASNRISPDENPFEIIVSTEGNLSQATLRFNRSELVEAIWTMMCVGESDGQRLSTALNMVNYHEG